MIVVVGSPLAAVEPADVAASPAGTAATIAMAAAAAGSEVQLVGKAGEDAAGDEVVLGLASASVGHVALLRDAANATPRRRPPSGTDMESPTADAATNHEPDAGLPLEAADIDLALRYLPDYSVVVVADDLQPDATRIVLDAATWAGARVVLVTSDPEGSSAVADDSTVAFERPGGGDADGAFARFVGEFAAALDRGASADEALRELSGRFGAT